jgi:DNA-binding response OmpR family regulator
MGTHTINLLHVEDDVAQRLLVAHHLKAMDGFKFSIVHASTEEEAIAIFGRGGIDFVILDYHLEVGDGLGCLRQVRRIDPLVPVIVISGTSTPEISAELLRFGADDYLPKSGLDSARLAESIRSSFERAAEWRRASGTSARAP